MNDYNKTKAELLQELAELRQEVARLKVIESECLAKMEQVQAEESLRASEIRNRTLLQAIPDMIIRYRGDGTYLDIKPSKDFQAFRSPSELIGKNLFEVAPPEVAQQRMYYIQLALQTGQVQTYEHSFMREGEARFEEIWVVPSGLADEAFVVVRDVTEPRRAEETLRQNEALLRTIIDTTPDWILVKDREHRFRLVNQSFADSVHLTPADLLGKTDLDLGIPEEVVKGDPEKGIRGFWVDDLEVMNSGQTKFIAEEPIVVDGQAAFLSTVKSPLRDANGEVWGLLVFVHDITERKHAEEVLARRAAELQTVAQVGTATATILETDKLLQEVVDLTKRSFRLYHAHIYLLNEAGDTLVLAAGAGEVGRRMVAQGWSIPLERERSLVAQAARTRQGVVANDVRQAPGFLPNPLLPDTHAEMAVPLIRGEKLLGVLDVQADVVDYFSAEDVQIQTILASQIAAALQNARSFAEQQQTQLLLSDRVKELNCLNEIGREIAESPPVPELLQWVTERIPPAMRYSALCQAVIEYEGQIYGRPQAIELPCQMTHALRIGGEVMGRIYISYTEKQEFLDEESALIGGIASRLSGYIESRRLLEQVQDALAAQEHLTVELDSQRRTLQAVLDNMPAGIFVAEAPSGKPLLANEQVKQLLGRGIALDVNKKETGEMYATYRYGTDMLYPPDQTPLARGLLGESITVDDMEVHRLNGRRTLLQVVGAPIRNAQGSVSASVAIFQDITERKQAEETLKESEERFRVIAETTPIPILISGISDGLILYGNEQLGQTFGLAVADLIGKQTPDFYYNPADRAALLAALKREGRLHDYELHVKKADGTPFWVLVSMQPLVFAGQPAMLAAFYDVTERKRAEEVLRRSQEQLSGALETAKLAYWEADIATMMFTFNDQFYSLLRTTAQQEGGYLMPVTQYAQKFLHPDDAHAVGAEIQKSLETTDPNYSGWAEHRIIRADGSESHVIVRFRVIKDEQGRTVKTIGATQDITERKQAEEALKAEQEWAQTILDSVTVPMVISRVPDGTILYANDPHSRFFSIPREQLIGQPTRNFFEDPAERDKFVALLRSQGTVNDYEVRIRKSNGEVRWVLLSSRLFNFRGEAATMTIMIDITERKQADAERERLLGEIEATYRQYVHREWEHFLSEQHQGAIRIEHQATDNLALNIEPAKLDAKLAGLQDEVIDEGKTKVVAGVKVNGHSTEPAIVAPIALRGQVIGTLSLQDLIPDRQWTAEEVALVETVSEQLAQTLENLRLFEDTQKQATREQLTRQITDKLRAAPDIDTIIQTGLTELAKALNVSRAYVKLTTKPEDD
ncbi:MAG: PAS domain S-box protein [Anaerolineales bacterium]|nr:PAS domain S-box protein [Anaerolineales bacterium]